MICKCDIYINKTIVHSRPSRNNFQGNGYKIAAYPGDNLYKLKSRIKENITNMFNS